MEAFLNFLPKSPAIRPRFRVQIHPEAGRMAFVKIQRSQSQVFRQIIGRKKASAGWRKEGFEQFFDRREGEINKFFSHSAGD